MNQVDRQLLEGCEYSQFSSDPKAHNVEMKRLLLAFFSAYQRGIAAGDFYEEPIGDDFLYPDW